MKLAAQRCLLHPDREAAVRCPVCQEYFCRECVTEHDYRFVCASCLRELPRKKIVPKASLVWLLLPFRFGFGFLLAWFIFYVLGHLLLFVPPSIQDGSFLFKLGQ
ncbi:MAG TPA: rhomboid family protein [Chthoniobacterales bacterium]|nr:rhomboid family protein [Chthoniobacterales bacterium]